MTPINPDRRLTSARAALLATYPSLVAASDTLALSPSLTVSGRVRARQADAVDTAAACATSVSLACALCGFRRRVPMLFTRRALSAIVYRNRLHLRVTLRRLEYKRSSSRAFGGRPGATGLGDALLRERANSSSCGRCTIAAATGNVRTTTADRGIARRAGGVAPQTPAVASCQASQTAHRAPRARAATAHRRGA
jgi:hypothetical protein